MKRLLYIILLASTVLSSCGTRKADVTKGKPVDLGLSVLWADRNLCAANESETGIYISPCWNDSIMKRQHKKIHSPWGKGWKAPSQAELEELIDKCKWKWRSNNPKGYIVTGPNDNSIFLPCVASGYWSCEMDKEHPEFAAFMYFNSSYPAMSYVEPEHINNVRPVLKATKKNRARCIPNHIALADLQLEEQTAVTKDKDTSLVVSGLSGSILDVKQQSVWVTLQVDSLLSTPFVQYHSTDQKDGYPLFQKANDYIKITARGVAVFSFNVHIYDCDKAVVLISYKSGSKEDTVEEEITTTGNYVIPAIFTNKDEQTTIKLQVKSGNAIPTDLHLLNSYSKVVWEQ